MSASRGAIAIAFAVLTLAPGCGTSKTQAAAPLDVADGCQPLVAAVQNDPSGATSVCFLPFPSDFYTATDASSATGVHVEMRGAAKLVSAMGADADVITPSGADGFSVHSTIIATLPSEIAEDGLPNLMDDPSRSATLASPTLLVEVPSGKLIPHYVDLDARPSDPARRAIVLRAFAPLAPMTKYVVAFQAIHAPDGTNATPAEGFRRLRDRDFTVERDPALAAIGDRYETGIFQPLQAAGVDRKSLQLAWDFTTGTQDHPLRDMLSVRTQTLAYLAAHPAAAKITSVTPGTGSVWKTLRGTITAPMFLDSANPGAHLLRDASGAPILTGTVDVPFYVTVPTSVRDQFGPGRALAYGHGFFGDTTELDGEGAHAIGTTLAAIELGIEWWGMSKADQGPVANTLAADPGHTADFAERVHQAMVNWITLTHAIQGALSKAPELARPMSGEGVSMMGGQSNAGQPLYDPSIVYYFGASQGSILGSVLTAVDPDISRAVLNVGGGPFTHLMSRAAPFGPFFVVANASMGDTLKAQALIAMLQTPLDRIDPAAYAPHTIANAFDGSPSDRRVLVQAGLGDQEVPNLGTFYWVRDIGIPMTDPTPSSEFGIAESQPDGLTSAFTLWDFGVDVSQYRSPGAIMTNGVHTGLRQEPSAMRQMDAFYKSGAASKIIHPCSGPCDPE